MYRKHGAEWNEGCGQLSHDYHVTADLARYSNECGRDTPLLCIENTERSGMKGVVSCHVIIM